jgi:cobalt-zinc-cadmium efflux system outer membrane protein
MSTLRRAVTAVLAMLALAVVTGPVVAARRAPSVLGQAGRVHLDPARGLSIEALVEFALREAPRVLAIRAREDEARGLLDQAGRRPNPTLSAERREQIAGIGRQTIVGVAWPLDLFRLEGRTQLAGEQLEQARLTTTEAEWSLADEIRRRGGRALALVRQLDVSESVTRAARETRDLLAARVESGASPALERDQAEVEWRRLETLSIRLRADADSALVELAALAGLEPGEPLVLRDPLEAVVTTQRANPVTDPPGQAAESRPDVLAATAAIAVADARRDLLSREGRVDASVTVGYMEMRAGFPQLGLDAAGRALPIQGRTDNVMAGVVLKLPWRNRNQGAVAAAGASADAARHARDARTLEARADIESARVRDAAAARALGVFAGGLLDLAARNLAVVRESHLIGRGTLVDVLDETRRYLDLETSYTAALLEAYDARAALVNALGVIR